MVAAEAQAVQVGVLQESTYGTTPGTAPSLLNVRSQSMGDVPQIAQSDLITDTPDVVDYTRTSIRGGGGLASALQYDTSGALFQLIRSALRQTSSDAASSEITSVACASKVLSAVGLDAIAEVGDVVRVRTSTNTLVGFYRVAAKATNQLTVEGQALADIGASPGYKVIRGIRVKRGTARPSVTVEIGRTDVPIYKVYPGQGVNGFRLSVVDQAPQVPIEFDLTGKVSSSSGSTPVYGSAYTAAPTTPVLDVLGVQQIMLGTSVYAYKRLEIAVTNNLRARTQIGAEGPQSLGWGQFQLTGQLELYLDSYAEMTKLRNGTTTSMLVVWTDALGNAMACSCGEIKYTAGSEDTTGINTDEMLRLSFGAKKDADEAVSTRWLWFPA
jgi:hypothetical protein